MSLKKKINSDNLTTPKAVFAIDVVASVVASLLVMFAYGISTPLLDPAEKMPIWLAISGSASIVSFYFIKFYRSFVRYSSLLDTGLLCGAVLLKELLACVILIAINIRGIVIPGSGIMLCFDFGLTFALLTLIKLFLASAQFLTFPSDALASDRTKVLINGIDKNATSVNFHLFNSPEFKAMGFITSDPRKKGKKFLGRPVYCYDDARDIERIVSMTKVEGIVLTGQRDFNDKKNVFHDVLKRNGVKLYIMPTDGEIQESTTSNKGEMRHVSIEDLLSRDEITISTEDIRETVQGKTVMVTGAAGSIGSELCRQLACLGISELIMVDNAETPLHNVRLEFDDRFPTLNFTPVIADVRDRMRLDYVFHNYRPQIVFHAAAYKHVPLMEENPCEAVRVNVMGSKNVADKCVEYDVEKMVMISTDKAVNPTNIMGCTKRIAEIYVQSLGLAIERGERKGNTTFITTRFGNVLGSNGSVIPRFQQQISNGGPVTVTHPEIRRFFMTIMEACRLVMEAANMATGTQIFVFDMGKPVKIVDLAKNMIHLAGLKPGKDIQIEYTGLRPGEKLYEEVLATKENTLQTHHKRIFVAKVRSYEYEEACEMVGRLDSLSKNVNVQDTVILMKSLVPEFKSKNSVFEKFDLEVKAI